MILITGGTGLVGSHLALDLLREGRQVRALRRSGAGDSWVRAVFKHYGREDLFSRIQWVEGDVLDILSLQEAMNGCSEVYHTAAVVSYHRRDRARMYLVNVDGTANVVNAALEARISKFCHFSSIAALGRKHDRQTLNEDSEWAGDKLHTHYGITKNLSEREVWRAIQEGLPAVIVNPGFIVGAGDPLRSSTSVFTKLGGWVPYYPPGGTGMVAARDVAECARKLMDSDVVGERFVLSAENYSFKDYFRLVRKRLGLSEPEKQSSQWILELARWGEGLREVFTGRRAIVTGESIQNSSLEFFYDNAKIKKQLQMEFIPVEEAVEDALKFYSQQKGQAIAAANK